MPDLLKSDLEMTTPANELPPAPRLERGVLLLLGASGSGKGTIAKKLLEQGVIQAHVSMGDLLRGLLSRVAQDQIVRAQIESQLEPDMTHGFPNQIAYLEHCVKNGLLIPNAWTQTVIEHEISSRTDLHDHAWIMDGYPRRIEAAQHLLETFKRRNIPVLGVIHLSISKANMIERLLARGRTDDTVEAIENRYAFFQAEVLPTLEFLKISGISVFEIDTNLPNLEPEAAANQTFETVLRVLGQSLLYQS
jgi:adenylate kinase family enzyme